MQAPIKLTKENYRKYKNFEFDLYHGTSSYFLEDIKNFGFGFRDEEIFSKSVLENLFNELKKCKVPDYLKYQFWIFEGMLSETTFRYGGSYMCISREQAKRYVLGAEGLSNRNQYGSEYLNSIFFLYKELLSINSGKANEILEENKKLKKLYLELASENYNPILITYKNAPIKDLRCADDKDIYVKIDQIYEDFWDWKLEFKDSSDDYITNVTLQQRDFVIEKPIGIEDLIIESI
tara:strand:+ start:369 stop:1073 length:705 start_codon:yes stop_codon:yes gene_type:complete